MRTLLIVLASLISTPSLASVTKSYEVKKAHPHHAKGLKRTDKGRQKMQAMMWVSYEGSSVAVPGSVNLSAQVSPPENQGSCGSCWDFSLTKALRSEYMLKKKDPGVLEFNYLLNNCGPGPKMYGCNGGDFIAAESFLSSYGPGLNRENPYLGHTGRCKRLKPQASAVSYAMLGQKGVGPTFKDLAIAVGVQRHMLSVDVAAAMGDWESYSGGIYNDCKGGPRNIDHMINLIGYSCESSIDPKGNCVFDAEGRPVKGDGYVIVQNNWGTAWGEKGTMRTRLYGEDGMKCNAVATDALMFTITQPAPQPVVSPKPPVKDDKSCSGFLCGKVIGCWLPWCSEE